jgi:threonine/homoserine/homoserine lactone efflux protein
MPVDARQGGAEVTTPDVAWLLSAAGFALALSATPGPNNAMLAASGATFGIARSVPHLLGVSIGFPVMFAAVALGAGGALRAYPAIAVALHWIGAAYLLVLAWHVARARPADARGTARSRPLNFIEAALFQWANPKAWLIAISAIATYATEGARVATAPVLMLAGLFLIVCIPCTMLWTGIGAGAARVLRSPRHLRLFNVGMALLLVASLVPMLAGR